MTTPITRKQLRKALWDAEAERDIYRRRAENAQDALDSLAKSLKKSLREDGWTPQRQISTNIDGAVTTTTRWTAPDREAEREKLIAETRREILEKVIEALDLNEYETTITQDGFICMTSFTPDTTRFWKDIETALEVRAERKRQDDREDIEKKVAGLASPQSTFSLSFFPVGDFDRQAPKKKPAKSDTDKKSDSKDTKKKGGKK